MFSTQRNNEKGDELMLTLFVWNVIKTGAICFVIATVYAGLSGRMTEWFEYLGLAPTKEDSDDNER